MRQERLIQFAIQLRLLAKEAGLDILAPHISADMIKPMVEQLERAGWRILYLSDFDSAR